MSRDYVLPAEAQELISLVASLERRAQAARETAAADLEQLRKGVEKEKRELLKAAKQEDAALSRHLAEIEADRQALEALIEDRIKGFGFIAKAWADYEEARAKAAAQTLVAKSHPAPSAAAEVRLKGKELAEARRRAKAAEWVVALYEWHVPWIAELRDAAEYDAYIRGEEASRPSDEDRPTDPVERWLSQDEYRALAAGERNQRALDRYLKSRKSRWQLGRDYERFIGYLREQEGCRVRYQGILLGFEDLGRDVIAEKGGHVEIIQCKRWAKRKTIHEKHLFQLFGTVVLARLEQPDASVSGTFTTTTSLSEKAREVASMLDIKVEEQMALGDYPRIKCNLNRVTGERIYHLPFDQRYDDTVVEPDRGEFYASTVAQAEAEGFRRAWRWQPATA